MLTDPTGASDAVRLLKPETPVIADVPAGPSGSLSLANKTHSGTMIPLATLPMFVMIRSDPAVNTSATATTVTDAVAKLLSDTPSFTDTLMVRTPATGFCSAGLPNRTAAMAVWNAAKDAGPIRYMVIWPATAGPKLEVMPPGKDPATDSISPAWALVSLTVAVIICGLSSSVMVGVDAIATAAAFSV